MAKCEICDKKVITGRRYSYRGSQVTKRFPRTQKPNIRTAKIEVDGVIKRFSLCTGCLRTSRTKKIV